MDRKQHGFDHALPTPVPWVKPVLRAVFACPCFTQCVRGYRLPTVADQRRSVDPSHLVPAPPSAQIPGWLCSNGEPREQAHLPAKQPPTGQDPRIPSAHAHPCRPRHPGCPSPQGSLRTVRLRRDACCQRVIVCETAPISGQYFGGHVEQVDLVQVAVLSWFMPTQPTRERVNRRGSVLLSPRPWETRLFATARSGCCGL